VEFVEARLLFVYEGDDLAAWVARAAVAAAKEENAAAAAFAATRWFLRAAGGAWP
jgi:hypothetical protein